MQIRLFLFPKGSAPADLESAVLPAGGDRVQREGGTGGLGRRCRSPRPGETVPLALAAAALGTPDPGSP